MDFDKEFRGKFPSFLSLLSNSWFEPNNDHPRLEGAQNHFADPQFNIDRSNSLNLVLSLQNRSFDPYNDDIKPHLFDFFGTSNYLDRASVPLNNIGSGITDGTREIGFLDEYTNDGAFGPQSAELLATTNDNELVVHSKKAQNGKKTRRIFSGRSTRTRRVCDNIVKGLWNKAEDKKLKTLVEKFGERAWGDIGKAIGGRDGKQCRERWQNNLRPDIKRGPWNEDEEVILVKFHQKLGNSWAKISKKLPGRCENAVKNHWNATKRMDLSNPKARSRSKSLVLQNYMLEYLSSGNNKDEGDTGDDSDSYSSDSEVVANSDSTVTNNDLVNTAEQQVELGNKNDHDSWYQNCYTPVLDDYYLNYYCYDYGASKLADGGEECENPFATMSFLTDGIDMSREEFDLLGC